MTNLESDRPNTPSTKEAQTRPLSWEVRRVLATAMWEVLRRWNSIEFSQESQENLARANELLKEHSVIMYITHTSLLPDAVWSIALAISQLTNIRRTLGPVARKHEDFSNHPLTSILLQLARAMGVELFPVVTQASSESDKQYTRKEQLERGDRFQQEMMLVMQEVGALVGIAPQGKRNPEGSLLKAKSGIGKWEQMDKDNNLVYLPVAITTAKHGQPAMVVGEPLTLPQVLAVFGLTREDLPPANGQRAHRVADLHMERLASLVAEKYRGPYGKS